jgi:hypothetical protein
MELRITRLWHSEDIYLSLSDEHRLPPSPSSQTSSRWRGKEVTTMLQLTVKKTSTTIVALILSIQPNSPISLVRWDGI